MQQVNAYIRIEDVPEELIQQIRNEAAYTYRRTLCLVHKINTSIMAVICKGVVYTGIRPEGEPYLCDGMFDYSKLGMPFAF